MEAIRRTRCLALMSLLSVEGSSSADHGTHLVDKVRTANSRFKDVNVAVAEGYVPTPRSSGVDGGPMGVRYVNAIADMNPDVRCEHAH